MEKDEKEPTAPPEYPGLPADGSAETGQLPQASGTTVVIQQPVIVAQPRAWSTDICSCFDDMGICK